MEKQRTVEVYENYFWDFIETISVGAKKKIFYVLEALKTQDKVSEKFVKAIRDGLFELRAEYEGNAYRVFFCFDDGNIVILFNCFIKKSQKTPRSEIQRAMQLKKEYYGGKRQPTDKRG